MPDANGKPLRADYNTPNPVMNNVTYDVIKDLITLAFPALITLYAGVGIVFEWADVDKWVAVGGLVGTFLGVLLKIASKRYEKLPTQYDGTLVANDPNPDKDTYRLEFDNGLASMATQKEVRLKVVDLLPPDAK